MGVILDFSSVYNLSFCEGIGLLLCCNTIITQFFDATTSFQKATALLI